MSYQRRQNLIRKRASKATEAQRHLRNARRAKLEQAQANIDIAIELGREQENQRANNVIASSRDLLDEAEAICDVLCAQE